MDHSQCWSCWRQGDFRIWQSGKDVATLSYWGIPSKKQLHYFFSKRIAYLKSDLKHEWCLTRKTQPSFVGASFHPLFLSNNLARPSLNDLNAFLVSTRGQQLGGVCCTGGSFLATEVEDGLGYGSLLQGGPQITRYMWVEITPLRGERTPVTHT